ncbi:MAG: hypothetical protein KDD73_13220 [Anaerolineales bacterium]|nr:hypothetical protein [Anaerolineales bacterium]
MRIGRLVGLLSVIVSLVGLLVWASPAPAVAVGPCAGAWVNVSISNVSRSGNVVAATGTWDVGGGATGVALYYYIDGVLYQSETHAGTWGSWYFSDNVSGSPNTFKVTGYARVNSTTCWKHSDSESASIPPPQLEVSISCSFRSGTTYTWDCTANKSNGTPPYTYDWNFNYAGIGHVTPDNGNPVEVWMKYTCDPGIGTVTVTVTDGNGNSDSASRTLSCNEW